MLVHKITYRVGKHCVRLTATCSTTVENFLLISGQERSLWTRVWLEDYFLCLLNLVFLRLRPRRDRSLYDV